MGRSKVFRLTLPAILSGLSMVFLYLSALIPSGRAGVAAIAGLFPAAAVIALGLWGGVSVWAATGLLGFFLVPDRLNVLLYVLFFGLYPTVKSLAERIKWIWARYVVKLAFFNGILSLFVFALHGMFLPALPDFLSGQLWLLYLAGNAVFLVYDLGFTKLISLYQARVGNQTANNGKTNMR